MELRRDCAEACGLGNGAPDSRARNPWKGPSSLGRSPPQTGETTSAVPQGGVQEKNQTESADTCAQVGRHLLEIPVTATDSQSVTPWTLPPVPGIGLLTGQDPGLQHEPHLGRNPAPRCLPHVPPRLMAQSLLLKTSSHGTQSPGQALRDPSPAVDPRQARDRVAGSDRRSSLSLAQPPRECAGYPCGRH